MEENKTHLCFLGTGDSTPEENQDTASLIINKKYLVDTGWSSLQSLRQCGLNPSDIEIIFLTHCHHDHYLALPSHFYWWMRMGKRLDDLKIVGPAKEIRKVVDLTINFLKESAKSIGYPQLIELSPNEIYEDQNIYVETIKAVHQVPTLSYKFKDLKSGKSIIISGDSAYSEKLIEFARGSNALVHEAGLGLSEYLAEAESKRLHSTVEQACEVAQAAEVDLLFLVHLQDVYKKEALEVGKKIFSGKTYKPFLGEIFLI